MTFQCQRKNPRLVGPYDIIQKINPTAYRFALPSELQCVHKVFHITQLQKYVHNPTHTIVHEPLEIDPNGLTYEKQPVKIWIIGSSSCEIKSFHWSKYSGPIMKSQKPLGKPRKK